MTNEEIIKIGTECIDINNTLVSIIGATVLKIKSEDLKIKIKQNLEYLDCDAYSEEVRKGFRVFAKRLIEIMEL